MQKTPEAANGLDDLWSPLMPMPRVVDLLS